ncbi:MAG: AAA family ATPase [Pseudomonadota bacterium]|nr:AAA family ATPase [Pseudomonadota bacterium]
MPSRPPLTRPNTIALAERPKQRRLGRRDPERVKLYHSGRWQRLRRQVLTEQPICAADGCDRLATDVDHIRPLEDDGAPYDRANLQGLCRACHSAKTARETLHSAKPQRIPDWLEPSAADLTIVCGAPGSGKSTWVAAHASDGDTVIDLDAIMAELSGQPIYQGYGDWLLPALVERNRRLGALSRAGADHRAWFIVSAPRAQDRLRWRALLQPSRLVVIETPADECCRRIARDDRRAGDIDQATTAALRWWRDYRPAEGDEVVPGGV